MAVPKITIGWMLQKSYLAMVTSEIKNAYISMEVFLFCPCGGVKREKRNLEKNWTSRKKTHLTNSFCNMTIGIIIWAFEIMVSVSHYPDINMKCCPIHAVICWPLLWTPEEQAFLHLHIVETLVSNSVIDL